MSWVAWFILAAFFVTVVWAVYYLCSNEVADDYDPD